MNDNQTAGDILSYDTDDLKEALAIAALAFHAWTAEGRSMGNEPSASAPEPQISFMGKVQPITRIAALGLNVDQPASPLLRSIHDLLLTEDGEDTPTTVSAFAEALLAWIELGKDEQAEPAEGEETER